MGAVELVGNINDPGRELLIDNLSSGRAQRARNATDRANTAKCFKLLDLCLIWVSGGIAYQLTGITLPLIAKGPVGVAPTEFAGLLLLLSVLTVLYGNLLGLYRSPWRSNFHRLLRLEAESLASAAVTTAACMCLWKFTAIPLELFAMTIALSWGALVLWRKFIEAQPIAGLAEKRNVLIAGCDRNARLLRAHLEQNPDLGFVVKGFLDRRQVFRPASQGQAEATEGLLGGVKDLPSIVRAHFIDEIFVNLPRDRELVNDIARHAFASGVNVRVVPDLGDGLTVDRPVEFIGSFPTMTLHQRPTATLQLLAKRLADVMVSGTALAALAPVFALIAAVIKLDTKGAVFYKSVRVGKKGQTFTCYKFRTMVQNADALKESLRHLNERSGILFKIANDPRLTRVGRILRKFSLDELPQLWNVLRGDMSLVGPRPCVPSEYKQYTLEHLRRLDVVPGVTGLWQVEARKSPSFDDYVSLDKKYVDEWSLALDCKILWRTVGVVLAGTGQ